MSETIRIYVGCAPNHEDAESQAVLEYTLRKHASQPVEITWMKLSRDPESPFYSGLPKTREGWQTQRWATPFSGFRWAVPELCGLRGQAIYMDSDMIVLSDIAELWNMPFETGKAVMTRTDTWRMCVSKWNCASTMLHIDTIREMMRSEDSFGKQNRYFRAHERIKQTLDPAWNFLDNEVAKKLGGDWGRARPPAVKILHYTSIDSQPQLRHARKRLGTGVNHWFDGVPEENRYPALNALFDRLLAEAIAAGYRPENYCRDEPFGQVVKRSLKGYGKKKKAA